MSALDYHPRPPLSAAAIRALYEANPSPQATALAWEIWRLQRAVIALQAGIRHASGLRHRQDVADHLAQLLEYVQDEPCLNERPRSCLGTAAAAARHQYRVEPTKKQTGRVARGHRGATAGVKKPAEPVFLRVFGAF